jgi:hypothetical protein
MPAVHATVSIRDARQRPFGVVHNLPRMVDAQWRHIIGTISLLKKFNVAAAIIACRHATTDVVRCLENKCFCASPCGSERYRTDR